MKTFILSIISLSFLPALSHAMDLKFALGHAAEFELKDGDGHTFDDEKTGGGIQFDAGKITAVEVVSDQVMPSKTKFFLTEVEEASGVKLINKSNLIIYAEKGVCIQTADAKIVGQFPASIAQTASLITAGKSGTVVCELSDLAGLDRKYFFAKKIGHADSLRLTIAP